MPAEADGPRRPDVSLERLFDLSLDLLCVAGFDGYFRRVNPAFTRLLGYTEAELLAAPVVEFVHPDDRAATAAEIERLRRGAPTLHFENRFRDKDGAYHLLAWTSQPVVEEGIVYAVGREITADREHDELLRAEEARYRLIVEAAADAILVADAVDGRLLDVNPAACAMLRCRRDELLGRSVGDLLLAEEVGRLSSVREGLLAGGTHVGEWTARGCDGTLVPLEVSSRILPDGRWYAFARDIAERRRAEQDRAFLYLLGTTLQGIADYEELLATASRMVGEYLGVVRCDWVAVDYDARVVVIHREYRLRGPPLEGTYPLDRWGGAFGPEVREGRMIVSDDTATDPRTAEHFERSFAPIGSRALMFVPLLRGGRLVAGLGVTHDVPHAWRQEEAALLQAAADRIWAAAESARALATARAARDAAERARAEIEASGARFRAAAEAVGDIVWTADEHGEMLAEQRDWGGFTGQSRAEYHGFGWLKAVHPDDIEPTVSAWMQCVLERRVFAFEHRVRRHDGEYRLCAVRAVPVLGPHGDVREWVGVHTDITERARAEEQLRQAQKFQVVGTLAGGVAHEINNQMTAVLGSGDFALRSLPPDHPAAADIRDMMTAAQRAAGTSQQLLAFSRRQVTQPRLLDLHAIASELAPMLSRLLGEERALVVLPNRARRLVHADPSQIEQVLVSLVANARDATPPGGRVSITVEDVALDGSYAGWHGVQMPPGRYVLLAVADTGVGMDRATVDKIFEPFFTTKPVGQGTGLGLAMVYGIVKQHGGVVWAYSEPGIGTTMKVYLPAAGAPTSGAEPPKQAALRRATILVVEDEEVVRALVRRSFETAGYEVREAADGREALELVREAGGLPDLLVTDIIMPEMNGRHLYEALRRIRRDLPVLYMSGYTGDDAVLRGLVPEGAALLQKPFSPETLLERAAALLPPVT